MKKMFKNASGFVEIDRWEKDCWVNIQKPTMHELTWLIEEMGVPDNFLDDIEDLDERPRIESEEGWQMIIIRVPCRTDEVPVAYYTVPLGVIMKDDIFITVCYQEPEMLADFVAYANRKKLVVENRFELLFRLFLSSSVWYLKYLKQISARIQMAERDLEKSVRNEELQIMMRIENYLVYFITSLRGNEILLHKLRNMRLVRDHCDAELLDDVEIELRQARDSASIYSDIHGGMMDAFASVISNNQNLMLKRLTSASIILMFPTLIASFFGMNMPSSLENNHFSFWAVIGVSLLSCVVILYFFKKKDWY
ncbi:MAG: magnesium transporter CorA family protein [Prevotellaceae bacterium]|jgi:magnesium transporter|nr:magnesium transporter CorA family protein [Prevotellaceae bacterium]